MYKLRRGVLEITRKCCAKCIHCIIDAGKEKENELTDDEILNLIEDFKYYGANRVTLTGGEPFLNKNWPLYLNKIYDCDMAAAFMTNGMLIDDKVFEILKEYPSTQFGISLDGARAKTHDYIRGVDGMFEKTCMAIKMLAGAGFYVNICSTFMNSNYNEFDDMLKLVIDLGADTWQIQMLLPNKRSPESEYLSEEQYYNLAKKIAEYREKYSEKIRIVEADCFGYNCSFQDKMFIKEWPGCGCGTGICTVESDGNVKGCPNMNNSEGNIRQRSFREIWEDENSFAYNRKPDISKLTGYCATCAHKSSCRGGCSENMLNKSGNTYCLYHIEQCGYDA